MPDALPPVGVLLATLDPATLPLDGTELAFVMQSGQPRRTPVSSIGGGGASANTYSHSGAYVPALNSDGDGTASVYGGVFGVSRVGVGAGVPSIGDTVTVYGGVDFANFAANERYDLPLPFEAALAAHAVSVSLVNGHTVSCKASLGDAYTLWVFMDSAAANTVAYITLTYQTASAVDL